MVPGRPGGTSPDLEIREIGSGPRRGGRCGSGWPVTWHAGGDHLDEHRAFPRAGAPGVHPPADGFGVGAHAPAWFTFIVPFSPSPPGPARARRAVRGLLRRCGTLSAAWCRRTGTAPRPRRWCWRVPARPSGGGTDQARPPPGRPGLRDPQAGLLQFQLVAVPFLPPAAGRGHGTTGSAAAPAPCTVIRHPPAAAATWPRHCWRVTLTVPSGACAARGGQLHGGRDRSGSACCSFRQCDTSAHPAATGSAAGP